MRGSGPGAAGRTLRHLESGGGGPGSQGRQGGKERPPSPEGRRHPRPAAGAGAPALFVPRARGSQIGRETARAGRERAAALPQLLGAVGGPGRAGAGRASLCLTAAAAPRRRAAGSGGSSVPLGGYFFFPFFFTGGLVRALRSGRGAGGRTRCLLLDAFSLLEMTLSSLRKTLELCCGFFFFNCSSLTLQIENREEALML